MTYPPFLGQMPRLQDVSRRGVRVVSGRVWALIEAQWRDFRAGRALPPQLGRPGAAGVYLTDADSLYVCRDAEDYALRLTLSRRTLAEVREAGCAIVLFDLDEQEGSSRIEQPPAVAGWVRRPPRGLTEGGAREWWLPANPDLRLPPGEEDTRPMDVFLVRQDGVRRGPVGG